MSEVVDTAAVDVATCMYDTGLDPFSKQPVEVARGFRDRKLQRALMQFFKPANWARGNGSWWVRLGRA